MGGTLIFDGDCGFCTRSRDLLIKLDRRHRLSTVRQADRIVVISEGKVTQTGTFAELSATKGMFADFARRQLL